MCRPNCVPQRLPNSNPISAVAWLRSSEEIVRAGTPEARAFHTADVLDRVLEMKWHARTAGFTLQEALVELELVHEGPLQTFGDDVVAAAGLT